MTALNVVTPRGFDQIELYQELITIGLMSSVETVNVKGKPEVHITYSKFTTTEFKSVEFVITGQFDAKATKGPIDDVSILVNGKLAAKIVDYDIDLKTILKTPLDIPFVKFVAQNVFLNLGSDFIANGNTGNDTFVATSGKFYGARGDDTFYAVGKGHFDGGSGADTVIYSGIGTAPKTGVTVNLADAMKNTGMAKGDTYNSIENIIGSGKNDTLIGTSGKNTLDGAFGDDTLIGGKGADKLVGSVGKDLASYDSALSPDFIVGVIANLENAKFNQGEAKGDTYSGIEGLIGSYYNDILTGDGADNTIFGNYGKDLIDGGRGIDTIWGDLNVFGAGGSDTFVLSGAGKGLKTIMDYDAFDTIRLDKAGFGLSADFRLSDGVNYIVGPDARATANEATFLFDFNTNTLSFDADGSGSGAAEALAVVKFDSQSFLDINDFLVV